MHEDCGKYYPEDSLAIDERFTNNFRKNGGKFLYCLQMLKKLTKRLITSY